MKPRAYLEEHRSWPFWALLFSLLIELLLEVWVAGHSLFNLSYVGPTLLVLASFVLWFRKNKSYGLLGSALLGALLLNSVIDAAFAWSLIGGDAPAFLWASIIVPSLHFVVALLLLIQGATFKLEARWLFAGCLAIFVLRALLLIPIYSRWSGEIAGLAENVSRWTGVEIMLQNHSLSSGDDSFEELIHQDANGTFEAENCQRPNGEVYNSLSAVSLGASKIQWGPCGFAVNKYQIRAGQNIKIENTLGEAIQLRFSVYNLESKNFEKSWNFLLYPNSSQEISDVEISRSTVVLVYGPDATNKGVLALFPEGEELSLWIGHTPLSVMALDAPRN